MVQYTVHPLTKLSHPSKYNLSHIIFANDLCQHHSFTPSFTHIFVNNKSLTHHLSHILLHIIFATIFVPPSFTRQSFTHTFCQHESFTHHLLHLPSFRPSLSHHLGTSTSTLRRTRGTYGRWRAGTGFSRRCRSP